MLGGIQGGAGEPPGFVIGGKPFHEELELVLLRITEGAQQILNQLEHRDNVTLFRFREFRDQQDHGGE